MSPALCVCVFGQQAKPVPVPDCSGDQSGRTAPTANIRPMSGGGSGARGADPAQHPAPHPHPGPATPSRTTPTASIRPMAVQPAKTTATVPPSLTARYGLAAAAYSAVL